MSPLDSEQNPAPLPLFADPAAGALIGTFLLALCLGGPVGLVLVLVVWFVYEVVSRLLLPRGERRRSRDHPEDRSGGSP
jgi:hypothetical protein